MKSKDVFDILEAWYTERKKHKDKTFKQWLKHVGSLWTSKEEWAKVVRWESYRRIIKTCTWQILGVIWFMSYALVTGGDLWYTLGLSLASIPAGSIMFYTHEWVWDRIK